MLHILVILCWLIIPFRHQNLILISTDYLEYLDNIHYIIVIVNDTDITSPPQDIVMEHYTITYDSMR